MGDMADMLILQGYEMMADGDDTGFGGYSEPRTHCKYCKTKGLHWEEIGSGWRLADGSGNIHSCRVAKAKRRKQ